jgi:hypothetical protein
MTFRRDTSKHNVRLAGSIDFDVEVNEVDLVEDRLDAGEEHCRLTRPCTCLHLHCHCHHHHGHHHHHHHNCHRAEGHHCGHATIERSVATRYSSALDLEKSDSVLVPRSRILNDNHNIDKSIRRSLRSQKRSVNSLEHSGQHRGQSQTSCGWIQSELNHQKASAWDNGQRLGDRFRAGQGESGSESYGRRYLLPTSDARNPPKKILNTRADASVQDEYYKTSKFENRRSDNRFTPAKHFTPEPRLRKPSPVIDRVAEERDRLIKEELRKLAAEKAALQREREEAERKERAAAIEHAKEMDKLRMEKAKIDRERIAKQKEEIERKQREKEIEEERRRLALERSKQKEEHSRLEQEKQDRDKERERLEREIYESQTRYNESIKRQEAQKQAIKQEIHVEKKATTPRRAKESTGKITVFKSEPRIPEEIVKTEDTDDDEFLIQNKTQSIRYDARPPRDPSKENQKQTVRGWGKLIKVTENSSSPKENAKKKNNPQHNEPTPDNSLLENVRKKPIIKGLLLYRNNKDFGKGSLSDHKLNPLELSDEDTRNDRISPLLSKSKKSTPMSNEVKHLDQNKRGAKANDYVVEKNPYKNSEYEEEESGDQNPYLNPDHDSWASRNRQKNSPEENRPTHTYSTKNVPGNKNQSKGALPLVSSKRPNKTRQDAELSDNGAFHRENAQASHASASSYLKQSANKSRYGHVDDQLPENDKNESQVKYTSGFTDSKSRHLQQWESGHFEDRYAQDGPRDGLHKPGDSDMQEKPGDHRTGREPATIKSHHGKGKADHEQLKEPRQPTMAGVKGHGVSLAYDGKGRPTMAQSRPIDGGILDEDNSSKVGKASPTAPSNQKAIGRGVQHNADASRPPGKQKPTNRGSSDSSNPQTHSKRNSAEETNPSNIGPQLHPGKSNVADSHRPEKIASKSMAGYSDGVDGFRPAPEVARKHDLANFRQPGPSHGSKAHGSKDALEDEGAADIEGASQDANDDYIAHDLSQQGQSGENLELADGSSDRSKDRRLRSRDADASDRRAPSNSQGHRSESAGRHDEDSQRPSYRHGDGDLENFDEYKAAAQPKATNSSRVPASKQNDPRTQSDSLRVPDRHPKETRMDLSEGKVINRNHTETYLHPPEKPSKVLKKADTERLISTTAANGKQPASAFTSQHPSARVPPQRFDQEANTELDDYTFTPLPAPIDHGRGLRDQSGQSYRPDEVDDDAGDVPELDQYADHQGLEDDGDQEPTSQIEDFNGTGMNNDLMNQGSDDDLDLRDELPLHRPKMKSAGGPSNYRRPDVPRDGHDYLTADQPNPNTGGNRQPWQARDGGRRMEDGRAIEDDALSAPDVHRKPKVDLNVLMKRPSDRKSIGAELIRQGSSNSRPCLRSRSVTRT